MSLVPYVVEQTNRGERSYDIFSRLLNDRIVFLGEEVNDTTASLVAVSSTHLQSVAPTANGCGRWLWQAEQEQSCNLVQLPYHGRNYFSERKDEKISCNFRHPVVFYHGVKRVVLCRRCPGMCADTAKWRHEHL